MNAPTKFPCWRADKKNYVAGAVFGLSLAALVVCYGIVNAFGQCCIAPPSYSLISQYHDVRTRSTAMGIFQSHYMLPTWVGGRSSAVPFALDWKKTTPFKGL